MRRIALVLVAVGAVASPAAGSARSAACLVGDQQARLVFYTRTGGFVGVNDRLTIRRNGAARLVRREALGTTVHLGCTRLRALSTALARARFSTLDPVYAPGNEVADGFIESVVYRGRSVRVLTGASPPPRLSRVLGILRGIAATDR